MKKLINTVVAGVLFLTLTAGGVFAENMPFSDVDADHHYSEAINYLHDTGIVDGYEDGTFQPNNMINRAEFLKILVAAKVGEPSVSEYSNCFNDVAEAWYAPYVCYGKSVGWVDGYPDGSFKPEQTVNKVEAIKMLLNSQGIKIAENGADVPFDDVDDGQWYAPFVQTAYNLGVLEENDVKFGPSIAMQRQNVSQVLYNVLIKEEAECGVEKALWCADEEMGGGDVEVDVSDDDDDDVIGEDDVEAPVESILTSEVKAMITALDAEWVTFTNGMGGISKLNCSSENLDALGEIYDALVAAHGTGAVMTLKNDAFFDSVNFHVSALDLYSYENGKYYFAAYSGCKDYVEAGVTAGIDPLMAADGYSMLDFAVLGMNSDVVAYLGLKGASLNGLDTLGDAFVHDYASIASAEGMLKFLADNGANLDLENSAGETAIYGAITFDALANVAALIDNGASVTVANEEGKTPLHHAASLVTLENQVAIINALIAAGADVDAVNSFGESALHAAVAGGSLEAVQALIAAGASIDLEDDAGWTPLELASYLSEIEMVGAMME